MHSALFFFVPIFFSNRASPIIFLISSSMIKFDTIAYNEYLYHITGIQRLWKKTVPRKMIFGLDFFYVKSSYLTKQPLFTIFLCSVKAVNFYIFSFPVKIQNQFGLYPNKLQYQNLLHIKLTDKLLYICLSVFYYNISLQRWESTLKPLADTMPWNAFFFSLNGKDILLSPNYMAMIFTLWIIWKGYLLSQNYMDI